MITRITNFYQVSPTLFRGAQPDESGLDELASIGIRTIVSLRWSKSAIDRGRRLAGDRGMRFESIPLAYWPPPSYRDIVRFFSIVDNPDMHPIFVHCLQGCDRTGLFIALYRMVREGWTVDQAYEEMKKCGYHKIRVGHFKWLLYGYAWLLEKKIIDGRMA